MKSFRLDLDSVKGTLDGWPHLLFAISASAVLLYLGWFNEIGRVFLIAFAGIYFGLILRGRLAANLRAKYPNANGYWLLSIGLSSATVGVIVRMLLPAVQGGWPDYVWLTISFSTIAAFVMINRHDPDVFN